MKKTLITIALTTVVVLTLVGIVSSQVFMGNTFSNVSRDLNTGFGGGAEPEFYAEAPAAAPAFDAIGAPMVGSGGGDGSDIAKAVEQSSNVADNGTRLVIKNADMAIVVKDPKASMAEITKLAGELGGFVVSSNLYQSFYGPNNT